MTPSQLSRFNKLSPDYRGIFILICLVDARISRHSSCISQIEAILNLDNTVVENNLMKIEDIENGNTRVDQKIAGI